MEASKGIGNVENVSMIPKYCAKLAALLAELPLFDGKGVAAKKAKVLPLDSFNDARIFDLFNKGATVLLGQERAWRISHFGSGNDYVTDSQGEWIEQGLVLSIYDTKTSCPIEELERAYDQVLEKLVSGWIEADIEENHRISFKKDPEDFYLFIKEKSLPEEAVLIRCLVAKFSMEETALCDDRWKFPENINNSKMYLWVKKTALQEIIDKFGFKPN